MAEQEKGGELGTRSLEFELSASKESMEMLIGRDDISNSVITLSTWFSMFVYICPCFRFTLIGGNLTVDGEPQGNWRWNSNSRDIVASSPSFSHPTAVSLRRACSQASMRVMAQCNP